MPDAHSARPDRLFGTDGVRGHVGTEITPELAASVARAYASLLREADPSPVVLLGRDTRPSGPELSAAVREELCRCGVQVRDCGVIPTGALCLLVREHGADGGVVISASHNPPDSNGIKLVGPGGHKLPIALQHRVEDLILAAASPDDARVAAACSLYPEAIEDYLGIILAEFAPDSLQGLRVVLDCAHGAASCSAEVTFERLGAQVSAINCDTDGARINIECGSTRPQALAKAVMAQGADLGVAF
ncbi:MAG TPA: phosphoglucosamine mutase, partial [Armatimonadetes bacterium]|nr:phosphoglucosamine mutase [Armatimonadota bacterium]